MHVKREEAVRRASSLLSKALYFNLAVVLVPPLYILLAKSIDTGTYAALAFLALSLASLFVTWHARRALEEYDFDSALSTLNFGVALGLLGGAVVVGVLALKARNILKTI
ncbi:MAG: hypothetical protein QXI90_01250 [Thermofilum sp.]